MEYIYHIVVFILLYAIMVQSLNLIMGYVGIVSMCHAIFSAIGAYTAALMSIHLNVSFIFTSAAGFVMASIIGALIAIPSLRVRDEYLIVFTIGFQMVMYEFLLTARGITEGQGGIPGIPPASLWGIEFDTPLKFMLLATMATAFCFLVAWRVINSPFGRVLKAIREEESACRALGKNSLQFKILAFAMGGGLAAISGSLMAYYVSFVSPFTFIVDVSIFIIVMVVLGGAANFWGPLVGAAILIGLPEVLKFIPGAAGVIDAIREVLYGFVLMFLMIFRPQGILPEKPRHYHKHIPPADLSFETTTGNDMLNSTTHSNPAAASTERLVLEVKDVSKSFGGLQAVKDVSIELPHGEIIGLIGPNGCGKTTLFNVIAGHLNPDKGAVYTGGEEITNSSSYRVVKAGVARSWQDVRIFNGMSLLENVLVACPEQKGEKLFHIFITPWQVARQEKYNYHKALYYLELVGLLDKADELAVNLSASEQKLVAIARLLATECPVLLLDEPTAALDLDSVEKIIEIIKRIAVQTRKTILLVEHNLDVVRGLVHKTYFMSEGQVIDFGTPAELMSNPKLVEVYFGID